MLMRRSSVFVVCFVLLASAAPAYAAPPDNPANRQRVIVQLRPAGPSPRGFAAQFVEARGGKIGAIYEHALKGFAAELPEAAIDALSHNPNVVSITPDQIVSIAGQDIPTGFDRIEADRAPAAPTSSTGCPAGESCTDVDVAVLDTGSNAHPDLNVVSRVDCSALFGPCTENAGHDGHGHGTHVAGIAAALDNSIGVVGVAPGARIWSVKVLGDDGTGFLTSLIAGVDWVAARAGQIDVVNMSLAGAFNDPGFNTAITNTVAAGITFVAAAGNDGIDAAGTSPANHPDVIAVSAVADGDGAGGRLGAFFCRDDQTDDTFATFSNYGPVVDIAAPGVCIRSTWNDGGYATKSGTSMASPYVAGAAARYVAQNGRDADGDGDVDGLDVARVKADLLADGIPQNADPTLGGFTGDTDGFAEPLLFVNGPAFGGTGTLVVATPDSTPPPAPTLSALPDGFTVDLVWVEASDPESGILSYRLWRDGLLLTEVDHATLSYRDRGDPNTTYSYEVSAVNRQGGEGPRSALATATTSSDDPTDAGWWTLDDGGGTQAADASAWRRAGALVNGPVWSAGQSGGALTFDGSDDRLDLDPAILNGFGDITATMWLKTTKPGPQALVSGANAGNSNEYLIYLASPTNLRLYTGSSPTAGVSWNLPFSIADGAWHHLAVVRDDTRNRADLYLAGSWVGAWGVALDPIDIESDGLLLGQDQDSVGSGFETFEALSGTLDEVGLYTRVLSAAEIAELAEADATPPTAPGTPTATVDVLRVDLTWTAAGDPESGIAGYQIWRGTDMGGAKTLLAAVPGTQTSYPDARTAPTTTYYYEVRAVNGVGLVGSPSTPETTATTGAGSGDPALMGWWMLDDGTGNVAADSSDYGLDGSLVNGPEWDPDGQIGEGLTFNLHVDPTDLDDRVDLDAQILDGASDVTVALWVKTNKTGVQALVSGANAGNDAEFEVVLLSNPNLQLRFYTGETNETHVVWPVPGVADGTWHHLAVTRDAANDQATLYVDGISEGALGAVFNQLAVDPGGLLLGQEQDSVGGGFDPSQAFLGSLDDVRLYRRLLSDTEIADLAGLTLPDTTPPVISLVGDNPIDVEAGSVYVDAGATALDNIDGDLTGSIVTVNPVDTAVLGPYTVTYDVADSSGNPATQVTRTVNVVDAPVVSDVYAVSESTIQGSISDGDWMATFSSDDVYEALTEHHSGGRPSQRVSSLDHRWTFEIGNPDHVAVIVEARRAPNPDGDDFTLEYSTDGAPFLPLLVIDGADDSIRQAALPYGTNGTVVVRVSDSDRTQGNASLDTVLIDELFLRTTSGSSGMPQVSVSATDPTAAEAGLEPGEFTLTRSNTDGTLTVAIGLSGTAGPPDFDPVATSVDFPVGAATATVAITPVDDDDPEGSESVVLTVLPGSGYEAGVPASAVVMITDDDAPLAPDAYAISETTIEGSISDGDLTATLSSDEVYEAIREEPYAGGKRSRLEHQWTFDVAGDSSVVFSVEAFRLSDSDEFVFAYSTDGTNWTDMLTVTKIADDDLAQTFALPAGTSGTVYVRVRDTDRTKSDPVLATVWVDHMFIRSG
jgi:subtilisin family serine protease